MTIIQQHTCVGGSQASDAVPVGGKVQGTGHLFFDSMGLGAMQAHMP